MALLSVFSLQDVARLIIDLRPDSRSSETISRRAVAPESLRRSRLLGLAEELGHEIQVVRGQPLRRSASLEPSPGHYRDDPEFIESHRRGEILVAAMLNAFLEIWRRRLETLGEKRPGELHRDRVIEEGAEIADLLLTSAIRALDYAPSVDVQFGDYLSALLTGDTELRPDDSKYALRETLLRSFRGYGIEPASETADGLWIPPPEGLSYDRTHFEAMRRDPDELFRFIWENREALEITDSTPSGKTNVSNIFGTSAISKRARGLYIHFRIATASARAARRPAIQRLGEEGDIFMSGPMSQPTSIVVRAYKVGFGDCFLLSFRYAAERDRHVLIDFGSTAKPPRAKSDHMMEIAEKIREHCGGKLDAVVATHRHRDHVSGFATRGRGDGTGDVIAALEPEVVIQPWSEHPDAQPDAPEAPNISPEGRAFVGALHDMHGVSRALLAEVRRPSQAFWSQRLTKHLAFMGENNIANRSAVENLMRMGKKRFYVHYGSKSGLEEILPGVKVRVLGPPTLEQSREIRSQRHRDEEEFWHLQARANRFAVYSKKGLFPKAETLSEDERPRSSRWLINHMRKLRGQQLMEIVRILDKAMNNTSVILLFEAGGQKLLFPGDAQIENWLYALEGPDAAENRELLKDVGFYKVGHHGSLNATPKTLWSWFERKSRDAEDPRRLRTLVSTQRGKHGDSRRETEVPRRTLVEALDRESKYRTTEKIKLRDLFREEEIVL